MKKLILLSLTLVIASLACLETSAIAQDHVAEPSPTFVKVEEAPAGEVFELGVIATTPAPQICARVTAIQSLHVRAGASEMDIVLAWLKHGDVVRVIDQANPEWWRIERDDVIGFARSIYLRESECEK